MFTATSTLEQQLWDLNVFLHSLSCEYTSLLHNRKLEHSVDELDLGHHPNVQLGLQELDLQDHRDVHNRKDLSTKRC